MKPFKPKSVAKAKPSLKPVSKPVKSLTKTTRLAPGDSGFDDDEEDAAPAQAGAPAKFKHKAVAVTLDDPLVMSDNMSRDQRDAVIAARDKYFAENVILTLSPALSQYGAAAFYEACRSFNTPQAPWEDQAPHIQVKWVMVAMAAIGAHTSSPYKPLNLAPQDRPIAIFYDGAWRNAVYSAGTGKKPVWFMRDGYSLNANDPSCANIFYYELPPAPSFAQHFDHIEAPMPGKLSSKATAERPSQISRDVRSPSPLGTGTAQLRGNKRDLPPESDDYYPEPAAPAKAKPVKGKIKSLADELGSLRAKIGKAPVVASARSPKR